MLYNEEICGRPTLDSLEFKKISKTNSSMLEEEFFLEEVESCLKSCDGNKAPDLDGFNMKFLQTFWYLLKDDVISVFKDFYRTGKFVRFLNSTFIALIPKKRNPKDFRPISLVGCIYKLITKELVMRLFRVLGEVIGECHDAFVEGKHSGRRNGH